MTHSLLENKSLWCQWRSGAVPRALWIVLLAGEARALPKQRPPEQAQPPPWCQYGTERERMSQGSNSRQIWRELTELSWERRKRAKLNAAGSKAFRCSGLWRWLGSPARSRFALEVCTGGFCSRTCLSHTKDDQCPAGEVCTACAVAALCGEGLGAFPCTLGTTAKLISPF